tara:strand:+ start:5480 stop:6472 length:993 start_codon:yes stop_codon:yes gene_type:complete
MSKFVIKIKNFLKDNYQDIIRHFPGKLKKDEKQELLETQIYPFGKNLIEVLNRDSYTRLNGINYKKKHKIASLGTCFAEEVAYFLKNKSQFYNYINYEENVFNFSANWGRVFCVINLKQILKYSIEEKFPVKIEKFKKLYFDPFREHSTGLFNSKKDALINIQKHRSLSKKVLFETNVLIITLGQNEFWFDHKNNLAWGRTPPLELRKQKDRFEPMEYTFKQNMTDLEEVIEKLKKINLNIKIIFTVSPVAEYATFISENIVSQAFAGKCILRSVVHEISKKHENVFYFPSFEFVLTDNPFSFVADNMHVKRKKVFQILSSLNYSLLNKR